MILLSPLNYLKITGHDILKRYNYIYPAVLAVVVSIYIAYYNSICPISFKGIIKSLLFFIQIVPGFYITALAEIAAMNKDILEDLTFPPLSVKSLEYNENKKRQLTRRRFLCYMLGYLCFLSIVLLLMSIAGLNFNPIIFIKNLSCFYNIVKYSQLFIFLFLFFQLIIITFFNLYYLSVQLHTTKPEDYKMTNSKDEEPVSQ